MNDPDMSMLVHMTREWMTTDAIARAARLTHRTANKKLRALQRAGFVYMTTVSGEREWRKARE